MAQYKIVRTDKADEQLRDIIFYIADDSGSADVALKYLSKIETAIHRLKEYPLSGNIPKYSILRKEGYRILIVERHLVFYKISEKSGTITVYAVMDGRREYKNLI